MEFHRVDCGKTPASGNLARFPGADGVDEYHLMIRPTAPGSIETQLEWLTVAYRNALDSIGLDAGTTVLRRFFCSDLPNQAAALEAQPFSNRHSPDVPCAVSWIGQPPVPPVKVALWAYHVSEPSGALTMKQEAGSVALVRGDLTHYWSTGLTYLAADTSQDQTRGIFEKYEAYLQARGLSVADNLIRTWLFVEDIDANYPGMVTARREFFAQRGLTRDTHFVASTGVEGRSAEIAARVTLDAWAIGGVRPEQIRFLAALDHLSPTHIYGVTFERGTSVAYRDRKHVILSGTASIDRDGQILHPGNVSRQLDRSIENVEVLLHQAGATLQDMGLFIVYVRDPGDHAVAWQQMRERFGPAPVEVVVAPICRPGWLIEVEGMAIVPASNPELPAF